MELTVIIVALAIVGGFVVVSTWSNAATRRRRLAELKESFGKPPKDLDCEIPSISKYAQYFKDDPLRVDDITWNDLDMDKVFKRVNVCQTSVGEEYLYNCLHELPLTAERLVTREALIEFFREHPDKRLAVQSCLSFAGKENYNGLPGLIFMGKVRMFKYPVIYSILAWVPLLAGAGMLFSLHIGFFALLAAFVVNLAIYLRTKSRIDLDIQTAGYLTPILKGVNRICKTAGLGDMPGMVDLKKTSKIFKPVIRKAPKTETMAGDLMDDLFQYVSIFFLYDIRKYNKFVKLIGRYKDELHMLYCGVGEIEVALCVLSLRMSLPDASVPEFHEENRVEFSEISHPLVDSPVANSGRVEKSALITGSNASGKSTFIKALAINGILAQTLNTVAAEAFKMRLSLVMTSMALRDDISGGDSYFIVEIKSLKRILDTVREYPCMCFVDEILRGTNTVERIAASSAVLEHLHTQDCICVAASHDIELTRILDGKYSNYHFREQVTDDNVVFDYLLKKGPSTTRNALKLLALAGFDSGITKRAEYLAGDL